MSQPHITDSYFAAQAEDAAAASIAAANRIATQIGNMPMIDDSLAKMILAALSARIAKEPGYGPNHPDVETIDIAHDDLKGGAA